MSNRIRTALATLAVAAVSVTVAAAPASASAEPTSSSTPITKQSSKGWPRYMDRVFLNGCGHNALCRDALHWLERHYTVRQVARHADNPRWIRHVAQEAMYAIL